MKKLVQQKMVCILFIVQTLSDKKNFLELNNSTRTEEEAYYPRLPHNQLLSQVKIKGEGPTLDEKTYFHEKY